MKYKILNDVGINPLVKHLQNGEFFRLASWENVDDDAEGAVCSADHGCSNECACVLMVIPKPKFIPLGRRQTLTDVVYAMCLTCNDDKGTVTWLPATASVLRLYPK